MPKVIQHYVRIVDAFNHRIGRLAMLLIFVMGGVLFYSSITKAFFNPALWTFEFAQFLMVAYFMIGGPYSIQLGGHVRMDLIYCRWKPRTQNRWDAVTSIILICYLFLLLYGAVDSAIYAVEYKERSYSIWRPYMWPIKFIMVAGIFLMLLQAVSQFFKDLAFAIDRPIEGAIPDNLSETGV
jgi:TRAP-type mannitol/chloroaromatic compound transport system permease small subunit